MVDINSIIEGTVKFRDGKKWKSRWCVMRKLSPVADCLHLQFYRDSKERYKNGQTKASLSLEQFLGIESGFTLDKESNTIAIICQDVIVILAFDTREILMQWQVKISNNLGDDVQYLILIASAATKSKIPAGPARLHIKNYRFCITTGIPPRLAGMWDIAHLRRYGVVENRFCFEGGSSSGKCEGFVILITDFGEEITNAFKLAAQGNLSSKKRHIDRKTSGLESPRKFNLSLKDSQNLRDDVRAHSSSININYKCDCSNTNLSYWPSQESRGQSFNGCDSSSLMDDLDETDNFSRKRGMNLERCMSCHSKQSAPSMSRSSTITDGNQSCFHPTIKGMEQHFAVNRAGTLDRMSIRSQESCSNFSEYSIPRQCYHVQNLNQNSIQCKPPHAARTHSFSVSECQKSNKSFEIYENPKPLTPSENQNENYDKPRSIKMYLEKEKNTQFMHEYGNYDTPTFPKSIMCGCNNGENAPGRFMHEDVLKLKDCACHRVMSWADNWISLPYCRRGNGIENTGVPVTRLIQPHQSAPQSTTGIIVHEPAAKCKLSYNGSMDDKYSLYASIDTSKKTSSKRLADQKPPLPQAKVATPSANYANLNFEKSLENYENAKDVLQRERSMSVTCPIQTVPSCEVAPDATQKKEDNYLVMEVREKSKTFSGYISMHPANSLRTLIQEKPPTNPSLQRLRKTILFPEEKSYSNPDLNRPSIDNILRSTHEINQKKILLFKKSSSVDSFRYLESDEFSTTAKSSEDEPASSMASTNTITYQELGPSEESASHSNSMKLDLDSDSVKTVHIKVVHVRNLESAPKSQNRDSSSSNDSGVSTASNAPKEYSEFELPLINQIKRRKHHTLQHKSCVHQSMMRRSKSFDPFGDLSFQFENIKKTEQTSVPSNQLQLQKPKFKCPSVGTIMTATPYIDSNSTSSGTSDMSDYIETLSLSSHSSSDLPEGMRKHTANTLRPRSGKEYQNIDRSSLSAPQTQHNKSISSNSSTSSHPNYANITPVPENSESPSPGKKKSSTSFQEELVAEKTI